ncbi:MAG: hypothetical protein L3J31_00710, partial [Bacteroidales bacterium]|nr:hypothetical protein [Bacteroidales bacterium]
MKPKPFSRFRVIVPIALIFLSQILLSQSLKMSFNDSWGKQGVTVLNQNNQTLSLSFSVNSYTVSETTFGNEKMQTITMPGVLLQGDEGSPDLPVYSRYIAVPQGAEVVVNIRRYRTGKTENILIAPAPRIPFDTETGPLHYEKKQSVYNHDAFYPEKMIFLSEPKKIRGIDVVILSISPFQYNPVTRELIVNRDIEFEVVFEGGNGHFGDDRLRSRWWESILRDAVINQASIPPVTKRIAGRSDGTGCEYLIITPDDESF